MYLKRNGKFLSIPFTRDFWLVLGPAGVYFKRNEYDGSFCACVPVFGIKFHPLSLITRNRW